MPLFSVIIPAYNRFIPLQRAVRSVLAQTFKDYELIIVDDGSSDETPLIINIFANSIKYLRQNNTGVSGARNMGVRASDSEYIAFLDSDDEWLPDKLARHAEYVSANKDIKIHQTDEIWIRNGIRVNPAKKHLKRGGYIFRESLGLCLISPSAVVMTRPLFEEYGPFDETLKACEDYDLWLNITPFEQAGLISERLVIRHGGANDQLSSRFPMMDAFRVYSIARLLKERGQSLRGDDAAAAAETTLKKIKVLSDGSLKRGKIDDAAALNKLADYIISGSYSSIPGQTLEEIRDLPLLRR